MTYVNVDELPPALQKALASIPYTSKTIEVCIKEKTSLSYVSGDGYRAFCCAVNLETGDYNTQYGSWGGSNVFEHKAVDHDDKEYVIPNNVAFIIGNTGHKTFAHICLSPANIVKGLLPAPNVIDSRMYKLLKAHTYIGDYKKQMMKSLLDLIQSALDNGFIEKRGRGTGITAKGRNTMEAYEKDNPKNKIY